MNARFAPGVLGFGKDCGLGTWASKLGLVRASGRLASRWELSPSEAADSCWTAASEKFCHSSSRAAASLSPAVLSHSIGSWSAGQRCQKDTRRTVLGGSEGKYVSPNPSRSTSIQSGNAWLMS